MPRKHTEINELQSSMFEADAQTGDLQAVSLESLNHNETDASSEAAAFKTVYGPDGSYVDITDRAQNLSDSLKAIGLRNQRLGFGVVSNTNSRNAPVWARYKAATPRVQAAAERNAKNFDSEAKLGLWRATGFTAMKNAGLIADGEMTQVGSKMWRDFDASYGSPLRSKERAQYARKLARIIKRADAKAADSHKVKHTA